MPYRSATDSLPSRLADRIFQAEGELARLCRDKDWSATPLGPVESWPVSLRAVAGLVVASPMPMVVLWGPQLVQIYNDGYCGVMGEKHPVGLGQPTHECWPELSEFNAPLYEGVIERRETFTFENERLVLERHGVLEEAWFTLTFSPAFDDVGEVGGILVTVSETTTTVERMRVEQALRESEERYRLIGRATNDIIWDWNLANDRLDWNEAVFSQLGYTSEMLGPTIEGWYEHIHPEDHERVLSGIHAVIEGDQDTWSDEYRFRRRDGSHAVFLDRGYIARDASGRAYRMIGSMLDLTERRRMEEALRESETRFRAVADLVPDLLWRAEPDGSWAWGNRRWTEYTGQPPEAALGHGWVNCIHTEDRESVLREYQASVQTGERFRNEHRVRSADGTWRWFLVEALPVRDADGAITQWFGSATDIHDQRAAMKRLEELVRQRTQSLAESEERFRLLVTTSAQVIWSTDAEGNFVEDSPTWRAFTGQSVEQWLGAEFGQAIHPEDLPDTLTDWRHSLKTETPFFIEYRLWHAPSATWRWVVVHGIPLQDEQGSVTGWFGTCTDIEERKRAEEEVRRMAYRLTMAEQEERRRVSQILHDDLQQLLYGLQLQLRMVTGTLQRNEQPALADIVDKTRDLLKQAIDTTRQLTVDLSPPILRSEGLADALEWLQRQIRELHGLEVELCATRDIPPLDEDVQALLFQVVRELLFNVKKHAGVDRARVVLGRKDRYLVIRVEDEGQGMELERTGGWERSGTGFGLSGARERLRQIGGYMEIDSAVGCGMCVTIQVPCDSGGVSVRQARTGAVQ